MSSLPRMLLRCCQSVIIALALCLIPEVEASFAQSARDIASDLDTWVAQEILLPSPMAEVHLADSPVPESTQTPEFSDPTASPEPSSAPSVNETQALPSPAVGADHFFSQPTIGSQLLLPPGEEAAKLLLAPAPQMNQGIFPTTLETQLTIPTVSEGKRQTSLAPISSQRFLPPATLPVGLLPAAQEAPANPLTIAIENSVSPANTAAANPTVGNTSPRNNPSTQERVGQDLARTVQRSPQRNSSLEQAEPTVYRSVSTTPRSAPALLPASTVPESPVSQAPVLQSPATAQRSSRVFGPIQQTTLVTARTTPKPSPSPVTQSSPVVQTEETPEPGSVASRELGVAIAPPEPSSLWRSWQNQILVGLGALAFLLLALLRWALSGGQDPLPEETDWDHLPRSKSKTIDTPPPPARPKRVSEEFLQWMETGGIAPIRTQSAPILVAAQSVSAPEKAPRSMATNALLDRKPRHRDPLLPWDNLPLDNDAPRPETKHQKSQQSFSLSGLDLGIWLPIAVIGVMGLVAWLLQSHILQSLLQ